MNYRIGVDKVESRLRNGSDFKRMRQVYELEKLLTREFPGTRHCILRHATYSQIFYTYMPMLQEYSKLCLPISEQEEWGAIDMCDMVDAIFNVARKARYQMASRQSFFAAKLLYLFTPERNWRGPQVARMFGENLDMGREIEYLRNSQDAMRQYLQRIRDDRRFRDRPQQVPGGADRPYTFPLGRYLNDDTIEFVLETYEMANQGMTNVITKDLLEELDRQPQDLRHFFRNNRDQFQRLR